jgi:hypothetical protein
MDPSLAHSHSAALIGRLGTVMPPGLVPFAAPAEAASATLRQVAFRFSYREVPCTAIVERQEGSSILRLVGNFGPLPYTAEGAVQRRRALQVIAATKRQPGLGWHLSPTQSILFTGDFALPQPLTPPAMISGVVGLLLRADDYIGFLLEILGDSGWLTAPRAA